MTKAYDDEIDKIGDFLQLTTSQEIKKYILILLQFFRAGNEADGAEAHFTRDALDYE